MQRACPLHTRPHLWGSALKPALLMTSLATPGSPDCGREVHSTSLPGPHLGVSPKSRVVPSNQPCRVTPLA